MISGIYNLDIGYDYIKAYDGEISPEYQQFIQSSSKDSGLDYSVSTLLVSYDVNHEQEVFDLVDQIFPTGFVYTKNYTPKLIGFSLSYISDFTKVVMIISIFIFIIMHLYLMRLTKLNNQLLMFYGYDLKSIRTISLFEVIINNLLLVIFIVIWCIIMFSTNNVWFILLLVILNLLASVLGVSYGIKKSQV